MFVIELLYKAPLAEIDAAMAAHVAFLKKHYASGHFLVSGRKIPRDGGIIIAAGSSRDEIEAIVREDPFVARGLADVPRRSSSAPARGRSHSNISHRSGTRSISPWNDDRPRIGSKNGSWCARNG